jgi:hypothetical protein
MRPLTPAPPTSAGRPVRRRRAPARRCRLRPGLSPGPGRRPGRHRKRRAVQAIARSVAAQASSAASRSRPTTPARASAVSTSMACLSNRTSSESLSQKQPQAAQSAHTCGKPPSFGIPTAGMPGGGRPNIPGMAAAVEDSRTERVKASYRRLPSLAVNPDTSSRPRRSNGGRASITDSKRGKRTSSTELQRTVADQLIRLVRLDCPDDCGRAAVAGLSRAQ